MCGICGAVWQDPGKRLDASTLRRMVEVLRHRGPDDEGSFAAECGAAEGRQPGVGVALGHRRLAVIDPLASRQPMANEDGAIQLVFNGEIYNYVELRQRLQAAGHQFRTSGDTETLVHLYEEAGPDFVEQLNGMFALALWDSRKRQLVLARDRLGEKPLVYRHEPGRLLFASQLKSLLEVPGLPRTIDPAAVDQFLVYQYVPHPQTIFQGFAKLPPGHLAVYGDGRLEVRPYWQPDFRLEEPLPVEEYVERVRELLTSAVALRLQSDVPLGAFLSGGVDSTIVVGLMRRLTHGPLRTFSIGFSERQFDEAAYARLVARHFQTEHEEFRVEPDAVSILPKLVWHYDEPFADSSAVPTWYLSQFTRQRVTVALTGDGGDELFAGYPRYQAVWLASLVDRAPGLLRRMLASSWWQRLPAGSRQKSLVRRWKRFCEALSLEPVRRYLEWIAIFNQVRRQQLYRPEFLEHFRQSLSRDAGEGQRRSRRVRAAGDPLEFLAGQWSRCAGRDPVTAASLADLTTYLPCDLMTKVDVASMAHGLETRQPLLDHRLVELTARMPIGHKFARGFGKRIFRWAFADLLPPAIARRGKMGFGVPLAHWFRNELREMTADVLFDPRTLARPYFRPEAVRQLWDDHLAGRFDHSARLWALLVLELWHRQWADG